MCEVLKKPCCLKHIIVFQKYTQKTKAMYMDNKIKFHLNRQYNNFPKDAVTDYIARSAASLPPTMSGEDKYRSRTPNK